MIQSGFYRLPVLLRLQLPDALPINLAIRMKRDRTAFCEHKGHVRSSHGYRSVASSSISGSADRTRQANLGQVISRTRTIGGFADEVVIFQSVPAGGSQVSYVAR